MKMCELKDSDCFYVPYGNWYGHVFEKDGVLCYNVNYSERNYILGNCDTEVEMCNPREYNVEWKLKQLGFKYNGCIRKILTINGHEYEVYSTYDVISREIVFCVPYYQNICCEENSFHTYGYVNSLRDIDSIYYAFETMCKELAEYDLIYEHKEE